MTREERIDWLCRLRCWVVAPPLMTAEQKSKFIEALTETIESLQTEPFINKPCVSEQACHEDKVKVLEKIKMEIEAKCCITVGRECDGAITLHDVFEIIDKYIAESEDKE